jgi:predicted Zn-dependent protease
MRFTLSIIISTLVFISCVTNPETGRKQLNVLPDNYMNQMGVQAYKEILTKEKPSKDKRLNDMITRIGKRIAKASGANFDWEFKLIESKTVNAFCLPGGKVAFYTGILPIAKNEAGVAAIMGHEVAHAVARHGSERMSQTLIAQFGMIAADLAISDPKYKQITFAALGLGTQFGVLLPYSRIHESEADFMGLKYMAKAGYDPAESVTLWQRMAKEGGARPPEILSTHPDPEKRSRALEEQQREVRGLYEKSEKQPSTPI